jgi:hypothetical protein
MTSIAHQSPLVKHSQSRTFAKRIANRTTVADIDSGAKNADDCLFDTAALAQVEHDSRWGNRDQGADQIILKVKFIVINLRQDPLQVIRLDGITIDIEDAETLRLINNHIDHVSLGLLQFHKIPQQCHKLLILPFHQVVVNR